MQTFDMVRYYITVLEIAMAQSIRSPALRSPGSVQSKLSFEDLESKQRLVLRSCGVQHPYLHTPLAAFEDAGTFCILYNVMDQVWRSTSFWSSAGFDGWQSTRLHGQNLAMYTSGQPGKAGNRWRWQDDRASGCSESGAALLDSPCRFACQDNCSRCHSASEHPVQESAVNLQACRYAAHAPTSYTLSSLHVCLKSADECILYMLYTPLLQCVNALF